MEQVREQERAERERLDRNLEINEAIVTAASVTLEMTEQRKKSSKDSSDTTQNEMRGMDEASWAVLEKHCDAVHPHKDKLQNQITQLQTRKLTDTIQSQMIESYMEQVKTSRRFLKRVTNPTTKTVEDVTAKKVLEDYRMCYVVSYNLVGNHPPEEVDYKAICEDYEIDYDTFSMFPGKNVQRLMPHQIAGKQIPFPLMELEKKRDFEMIILR
ncbi:hypothetical protein QQS21_005773 [Conoideocrella luteorostrata]|uniref:Uncharacterized protein n=1 Tax=Conoideocrella luteorostrata TaxID=1105319 RepID=A0AAJ0CR82_9HYPO|nr:hypothetical protein QQS21_005773 [Conoideocrella luteorostrata]